MNPFEEAIDLIERHGWKQMMFGNEKVGYCPAGALNAVMSKRRGTSERERELFTQEVMVNPSVREWAEFLCQATGLDSVVRWNDRPGRTKEEVLEKLRIASKEWANQNRGVSA